MMNKSFKKRGLKSMFRSTWPILVAAGLALSVISSASHAAGPLQVDLDGARILKLDSAASDVVIGNPFIADVTVQTPNRLVIIGKAPGVTNIIVMSDGAVTMEAQIVVSARNAASSFRMRAPSRSTVRASRAWALLTADKAMVAAITNGQADRNVLISPLFLNDLFIMLGHAVARS